MSGKTSIQWTRGDDGTPGATWNPIRARDPKTGRAGWHCTKPSAGCAGCYAESMNKWRGTGHAYKHGSPVEVFADEKVLTFPLRWRAPKRIFVCSMTDLFGEFVTDEMIDRVFAVMALAPRHTFQILTKRPERMRAYFETFPPWAKSRKHAIATTAFTFLGELATTDKSLARRFSDDDALIQPVRWPLPNVWLGVSVEDQATADERIPLLLQTPAAVRFASYEPALGPIKIGLYFGEALGPIVGRDAARPAGMGLDWVIVGGESGPGARPFDLAWARSVIAQCREAGVPVFLKQLGARPIIPPGRLAHYEWGPAIGRKARFSATDPANESSSPWRVRLSDRKGGEWEEWPEDLRVREFPR